MKKKKLGTILALTLGITCLSACTDNDKNVVFGRYWQENATVMQDVDETLEYDVSFKASTGMNGLGYTFTYDNGKYVTALKSEKLGEKTVYRYTTSLNIDVTYTKNGGEPETKSDWVETEVVFSTIGESLRPITSEKKFVSHTPINSVPADSQSCYVRYAYEVKTTYTDDGERGTSVLTTDFDDEEKKTVLEGQTFSLGSKYTYLDNEQLLFALRGISAETSSTQVNIYSPFAEEKQRVQITFNDDDFGGEFLISENGSEATKKTIPYQEVTVGLKETYSGASQTLWIAKPNDVSKNTYRNVILKMETPLSYNFGSLIYTLKSITNI